MCDWFRAVRQEWTILSSGCFVTKGVLGVPRFSMLKNVRMQPVKKLSTGFLPFFVSSFGYLKIRSQRMRGPKAPLTPLSSIA